MMLSDRSLCRRAGFRRNALMVSCASAAIAASILLPQRASAQAVPGAFQGSIQSATGTYTRATSGSDETITIGSPTATLNWTPYDGATGGGAIDFLPADHIATFINDPNLTSDYTVLNRIVPVDPTRPIQFNGTVLSQLTDGASTATGGHVWFYSPGGIVIGAKAVFDVGSLLLTTADLPNGFGANSSGFSAFFSAPISSSSIQILDGAKINAANNYVALIAPRIEQGGTVNVNGSAAYVAGEQLTMSFNQGLFDVSVDVGTDDQYGVIHTGTTTGTGNLTADDHHSIYMVAVPKNNAISMLLQGGSVGFTDASGATVENGQIILSSGYGVSTDDAGNVVIPGLERGNAIGGERGSITIDGGNFTSDVFAYASDSITASGAGGLLNFDHDVNFQALFSASLNAYFGDTILVGGDANIHADDLRYFVGTNVGDQVNAAAGGAGIDTQVGGSIVIAGNATVTANASATANIVTGEGGVASAGSASIQAEGGSLTIGGDASVQAIAFGDTVDNGLDGRASFGGTAQVSATGSGLVDVGGDLAVIADGDGAYSALLTGGTGGTGFGGIASIVASNLGTVNVHGATVANARGFGGELINSPDGTGGEGRGGTVQISSTSDGTLAFTGNVEASASGLGANTSNQGGEGDGGTAAISIDGGTITAAGRLALFSDGIGGDGTTGGNGFAGSSYAELTGGEGASAGGTLHVGDEFRIQAAGWGGFGIDNPDGAGGRGGDGFGGSANFYITNFLQPGAAFDVQLSDARVAAGGTGGDGGNGLTGGNGGGGTGGIATTELYSGTVTAADFETFATARGGFGGGASNGRGGDGGIAVGGSSQVTVDTALTANTVFSYDRAFGGLGGEGSTSGNGGSATGGNANLDILANGNLSGSADLSTVAVGGDGQNGGMATGGWSFLTVEGILAGPTATADSSATGGNAWLGTGGFASGGVSEITASGAGSITLSDLTVLSRGAGGSGINGGDGHGGEADAGAMDSSSAKLTVTNLATAKANGLGGSGIASGAGGNGYGGSAGLHAGIEEANVSGTTTLKDAFVQASGFGGQGGTAGDGIGGSAHAGALDGTFIVTGTLTGQAEGWGGAGIGSPGGAGTGGDFLLGANLQGDVNPATVNIGVADISVLGFGGAGGAGSAGGDGYGGTFAISVGTADSSLTLGSLTANVKGQGGDGGAGPTGGAGGFGYGGDATATILGTMNGGEWFIAVRGIGGNGGDSVIGNGGDGGYGEGGSTSLYTGADSSVHAASYETSANGIGGDGGAGVAAGNGGEAQGGYNESTWNGTAMFTGNVLTTAFAMGGIGTIGGDATGGNSLITVNGSLSAGFVQSSGQAQGGNGTNVGGNASAGSGELDVFGSLAAGQIFVATAATGGNGATAGDALGGTSYFGNFGSLTAGDVEVTANATGGNSSNDLGGDAFAGEAVFETHGTSSVSGTIAITADALGGDGLTGGGNASGYSAALKVGGGTASLTGATLISSTGTGGNSANGTGGTGTGGYARTSTFQGGSSTIDDLTVDSSGTGGDGINGGAGYGSESVEGWGGSVVQALDAGSSITLTGQTTIASNGTGGFGSSGLGGDGFGGSIHLNAALNPISAQNMLVTANGMGGSGQAGGGNGSGGDSIVTANSAALNISGGGTIQANGTGGNGGSGTGGNALGGYADVESTSGGTLTGGSLVVQANALSGDGASSGAASGGLVNLVSDAVESGLATTIAFDSIALSASGRMVSGPGNGAGGFVTILAPGGSITADTLTATAIGAAAGGDIALSTSRDPSGTPGSIDLGSFQAFVNGGNFGGEVLLTAGSGTTANLGHAQVDASGSEGHILITAGDCGCTGGRIVASDLALSAGGDVEFSSNGGGNLDVEGTLSVTNLGALVMNSDGAGGSVLAGLIQADSGSIHSDLVLSVGSILFNTDGAIGLSNVSTDGLLSLAAGGDIVVGDLQSGADLVLDSGGTITTGNLAAIGNADLSAGGNLAFANATAADLTFASDGSVSGGNITASTRVNGTADGSVVVGDIAVGPTLPAGGDFSVGLSSGTSIAVGNVSSSGAVGFATLGNLSTANIEAGGLILALAGGDIKTGSLTTAADGQVYFGDSSMFLAAGGPDDFDPALVLATTPVETSGSIAIGGPVSTGSFQAASGGEFTAGTIDSAGDLFVLAAGNIGVNSASAGGDASLLADGNLSVDGLSAGSTLTALATGNLNIHTVSAGSDLSLLAGNDLTVGDATAADTASFYAVGLASFTGTISAPTIGVTSSDINVADGASLGVFGVTDFLALNAVSDQDVIIGDQGAIAQAGQYVLNEDGNIEASNIFINAFGSEGPTNIRVYDVDIDGSETPGGGVQAVFLSTSGSIFVDGLVNFANAGANDTLTLAAGGNIEVNTDTGGIQMTDSGGHYGGLLALFAPNVWVGDGDLLAELEEDPNFTGRDAALKTNNGEVVADGYVRAGGIAVAVSDSFFVQNTGTADNFAGLTVGNDGLTIISTDGTVTGAAALYQASAQASGALLGLFGHQLLSDGTVVSGKNFTNAVELVGTFASGSTINDCAVGNCTDSSPQAPAPPAVAGSETILGPIGAIQEPQDAGEQQTQSDDSDDDQSEDDDSSGTTSVDPTVYLINTAPMRIQQTIDQPITSGNDTPGVPQ